MKAAAIVKNDRPDTGRRYLLVMFLLTLCGLLVRLYGLWDVPPSDDDLQVVSSALDYMERGEFGVTMWQHPKLRNILVYYSLQLFGGSIWGLKAVSLSFGTLSIPIVGMITRQITASRSAALLSALFMVIDPLHIDFSRQAVQEVHMPFFFLPAIYLILLSRERNNPWLLPFSGVLYGLGIASKWYVIFPLTVGLLLVVRDEWGKTAGSPAGRINSLCYVAAVFVLLPATVYILTYYPWFERGYGINGWLTMQKLMFHETVSHSGFSSYDMELDHNPLHWFIKPVAYADFIPDQRHPWILLAIPNPLVWLLTLPAIGYLMLRAFREKNIRYYFLAALFWASYLPLALSSRPIWVHTSFAVAPFAFMATAFFLTEIFKGKRWRKTALAAYLLLVIVASVPLYFLAIGRGEVIPFLRPVLELYRPASEKT